jgi:hypothetical protein
MSSEVDGRIVLYEQTIEIITGKHSAGHSH